jgi:hypothetical protein
MEMTIDKAIAKIQHCIVSIKDCVGNKEFVEALKLSAEIMRKYQKIKEIIKRWKDGTIEEKDSICAFHKIIEVVEDENNSIT